MRELGEGIRRIYDLMRNNDQDPNFNSNNKTFTVQLFQNMYIQKMKNYGWIISLIFLYQENKKQ